MAGSSSPRSDEVPELIPDNGSMSPESSAVSFDHGRDYHWDPEIEQWEENNPLFVSLGERLYLEMGNIPDPISFEDGSDGSEHRDTHAEPPLDQPPSPVAGPHQAPAFTGPRLWMRQGLLGMLNRAVRFTGLAPREPPEPRPRTTPPRGFWDSPYVMAAPGFLHEPEDGDSHALAPVDDIPPLDIGAPLVTVSEPAAEGGPAGGAPPRDGAGRLRRWLRGLRSRFQGRRRREPGSGPGR